MSLSLPVAHLLPGFLYRCLDDSDWTMKSMVGDCLGLTGFEPSDLVDNKTISYRTLIHPDDDPHVRSEVDQARSALRPFELNYRIHHRSGVVRWVWERGEHVADDKGNLFIQGFIFDATERHGVDEELRRSQRLELLGRLTGSIAHEFNNVLSVILNFGGFAAESMDADSPPRLDLEEVLVAARRAVDLSERLLAFASPAEASPRLLDINQRVGQLYVTLRRLLPQKVDFANLLGSSAWSVWIDPHQFEQVLINLATNASEAMPSGGTLTIKTSNAVLGEDHPSGLPAGEYVHVSVSDTGKGMDEATRSRVFEPFFSTKPIRGTGLGLSVCAGIVRQAGGDILVTSQEDIGSTFSIYLPKASSERDSEQVLADLSGDHEVVVVVDDEPMIRALFKRILTRLGYTVLLAEDGQAAKRLVESFEGEIDLLITDLVMPELGGKDLADWFHGQFPDRPVLYMSGHRMDNDPSHVADTKGE
ncbi:MAG: response regulator, partial [Myxococcales bacterium]|nr:response regulator [Myxococcales bacterium]